MLDISRRQFLHGATALAVATQLQAYPRSLETSNALGSRFLSEIMTVWQHWQKCESTSPGAYLTSRHVKANNQVAIARLSRVDFREGNLLEVKGMVLAKTEAAAISVLAERLALRV